MIPLTVNGKAYSFDLEPETPLLVGAARRDRPHRHQVRLRHRRSAAPARCMIDGRAMRSCSVPIGALDGGRSHHHRGPVAGLVSIRCSRPGSREDVPQCGYCQSGQIMAAAAFLKTNPNPTDADIDAGITNICRCGTYERMRRAIHRAAAAMKA